MAAFSLALLLLISLLPATVPAWAATAPAEPAAALREAPVAVFNRTVATYRAPFLGAPPDDRARRARQTLQELFGLGGPGEIATRAEPQGTVILVDGRFAMILLPEDADRLRGETLEAATARTVEALRQVAAETREGRDRSLLLRGLAQAFAATVALTVLAWGVLRVRRALRTRARALIIAKADALRIGDAHLLQPGKLVEAASLSITVATWTLLALFAYEWLSFVLGRFPYTRPWGEQLTAYFIGVVANIGTGVLGALPDLLVAVVIFMLARGAIGLAAPLFDRAGTPGGALGWLDIDTVRPTRVLFTIGVWLFAIVMAYPYLPGADSEAFKGMSVLIGLMLTVGGASLVGQGASGLILMYSRTLRVGEYVRVADNEGTVVELGTFTTRIRTGMGEEVTIPNAMLLSTVTRNYSRTVQGRGYIVDTTLTIGYDTPWRDVEAMMLEAARRTPGVLDSPAPRVFQTALSDFYVEYRVVCQAVPSQPRPRAEVLATLHQHLLDVFNERGVQIMSPHYFSDPSTPKLVRCRAAARPSPGSDRQERHRAGRADDRGRGGRPCTVRRSCRGSGQRACRAVRLRAAARPARPRGTGRTVHRGDRVDGDRPGPRGAGAAPCAAAARDTPPGRILRRQRHPARHRLLHRAGPHRRRPAAGRGAGSRRPARRAAPGVPPPAGLGVVLRAAGRPVAPLLAPGCTGNAR